MLILLKTKTFIKQKINILKSKLKHYHKIILQTKESDLDKKFDRNFYDIFTDWILEIIQYGTLLSISLIIFNINIIQFLAWIIPLGIIRWLVFDTIKTYKQIK